MRLQHLNSKERGSAILEGALVYLAFFMILIGTIDLGVVMFTHQNLKERVRNAARYGIAHPSDPNLVQNVQNLVLYGTMNPANGGGDGQDPGSRTAGALLGMTTANVLVTRTPGAYGLPDRLTVRATRFRYPMLSPMIAGMKTGRDITASLPMENP